MSFSYNFGANPVIDAPRMLIADTDVAHPIFQDEEVQLAYTIDNMVVYPAVSTGVALTQGTPSYRRAAAVLLDCLAGNKARLAAALEVLDIKIDGAKAAAALKDQAKALRDTEAMSGTFGIAEMWSTAFNGRQRMWNQFLRLWA